MGLYKKQLLAKYAEETTLTKANTPQEAVMLSQANADDIYALPKTKERQGIGTTQTPEEQRRIRETRALKVDMQRALLDGASAADLNKLVAERRAKAIPYTPADAKREARVQVGMTKETPWLVENYRKAGQPEALIPLLRHNRRTAVGIQRDLLDSGGRVGDPYMSLEDYQKRRGKQSRYDLGRQHEEAVAAAERSEAAARQTAEAERRASLNEHMTAARAYRGRRKASPISLILDKLKLRPPMAL